MQRNNKRETVIGMVLEDMYADFSKELIQSVLNAIPDNKSIRLVVLAGKYDHGDGPYTERAYKIVYNTVFKFSEICDIDGLIVHLGSVQSRKGEMIVEKQLKKYKDIPKVFIAIDAPDLTTVNYDNETGIREAVDSLVNVSGLTKLCMLGGRDDNKDAQLRKEIFARCLKENGISFTENNYIQSSMSVDTKENAGKLLDANPGVQAVFCVNDAVAKGLYEAMEERGLVPGRDVLVFGFDNTRMAGEMIPSLSSIGLADCTLGQKALELLLAKLGGENVSSALVPTRLYGRESMPHEMYVYTTLELMNIDPKFIYRMFDDCFYRYKSEPVSRESVDLKRLFFEFMSRMLIAVKQRYMSSEEFDRISVLIDKFFEKGAMNYTDAVKLIKSTKRIQDNLDVFNHSPMASYMVNKLFLRIKDRAMLALSEHSIRDHENFIEGREKLQQFLIDGTIYAGSQQNNIDYIIRNIDKLGIRNAALFLYEEPVVCDTKSRSMFPDHIMLRCVIKSGELYILPKNRQRCLVSELFTRPELPPKCKGFVALPVFYSDFIYGLFLCEIDKNIYNRGEYIAVQLGRTIYLNDELPIIRIANTDMLTGLFSRRYFYNYLSGEHARAFHLLYLDLDNFKAINDNFGHNTGDEVLIRTAELIKENFPDSVIARLVGDEFAVINESFSKDEIAEKTCKLETAVADEFRRYGCATALSIGITYAEGTVNDIDKLIQQSDRRMYEIKKLHHESFLC